MRSLLIFSSVLALSACTHFNEDQQNATAQAKADVSDAGTNISTNGMHVADNVRDAITGTTDRMRDWWLTPVAHPEKAAVPTSYCYHVLQDILCYRQPMPGWESKLAGYQGTGAEPPKYATTQPLPVQPDNASDTPISRTSMAKPIFVGMPAEVKESKKIDPSVPPDPANATLPDPSAAPQL